MKHGSNKKHLEKQEGKRISSPGCKTLKAFDLGGSTRGAKDMGLGNLANRIFLPTFIEISQREGVNSFVNSCLYCIAYELDELEPVNGTTELRRW